MDGSMLICAISTLAFTCVSREQQNNYQKKNKNEKTGFFAIIGLPDWRLW